MSKEHFINLLRLHLHNMDPMERDELIAEYEAHFLFGQQSGKKEEQVASELGDPIDLAKQVMGDQYRPPYHIHEQSNNVDSSGNNSSSSGVIIRSLGVIFLSIFIFPFLLTGWTMWLTYAILVFTFLISPFVLVLELMFGGEFLTAEVFLASLLVGIGLLLVTSVRTVMRWYLVINQKYFNWMSSTIKGRK
ncbi:DUF1700 domain-containing protein [Brevibacillus daliensis]|uniref:DUF1700 domain-containing protein n=1 Tax=Brevibacillus daliensis TaxID=2892995 RepID=UPI001E41EB84|nr:DUF1700 domain-containing protein [Brevibacillus daliensis]